MKKTSEVKAEEAKIEKEIAKLEKQKSALEKKLSKMRTALPFQCKKCKMSYAMRDVHVMAYEVRETHQHSQYGGEYDMWQETRRREIACCPKCGKSFHVKVGYDDFLSETPHYSRWEEKPELKEPYEKKIWDHSRPITSYQLKYLKEHWRECSC